MQWIEPFTTADGWVALATLTALEVVLGIDNIVFISILAGKVSREEQPTARRLGLSFALITRLGLLFAISWIMGLTAPLFTLLDHTVTGRSLILLVGGLFLIAKASLEIYEKLEVEHAEKKPPPGRGVMAWVIVQIMLLDLVFSLDSVVTAVGMVKHIPIMVAAMVLAVGIMLIFAGPVGDFVNGHPSLKVLALAFLLLIGVLLVAEGFGQHISKGYVYFAMGFSLLVELINMRVRKRQAPVELHRRFEARK